MNDSSLRDKPTVLDIELVEKIYTSFEVVLTEGQYSNFINQKFSRDKASELIRNHPSKTKIWASVIDWANVNCEFRFARSLTRQYQSFGGETLDLGNSITRLEIAENSPSLLMLEFVSSSDVELDGKDLESFVFSVQSNMDALGALKYQSIRNKNISNTSSIIQHVISDLERNISWDEVEPLGPRDIWTNEAVKSLSKRNLEQAKAAIEMTLLIDPENETGLYRLAEICELSGDLPIASVVYGRLGALYPSSFTDYKRLKLHILMGESELALAMLDRLVVIENLDGGLFFELGNLAMEKGDDRFAEKLFYQGRKHDVVGALCCTNLAAIYRGRNQPRKALRYARYAYDTCAVETKDQVGSLLAQCYYALNQTEKGRELVRKCQWRIIMTGVDKPVITRS